MPIIEANSPSSILMVSSAALIDADGRVLLAQRPLGKNLEGMWEFPGGKVEPNETPESALIRELKEELDIDTKESCLAPIGFSSHAYESFHLLLLLYVCRRWWGTPIPCENNPLKWVRPAQLGNELMPPADKPLIHILQDLL